MTLRASKRKLNPALGLLKATLSKNIGIIILMSIAMLIFCPGFLLTRLSGTTFRPGDYYSPDVLDAVYSITTSLSCVLVCIGNYLNFSYLYKKSSSDVFGALPLTRSSLLLSRAAASFIGVLIPVTIGYISLSFLSIPYPAYAVGTVAQISAAYLMNILFMAAFSAFSLFFIVCAGSAFDLAISFFGFNAAVLAVGGIINSLCDTYLSGYSNSYTGIMRAVSPVYYLIECGYYFADNDYAISTSLSCIWGALRIAVIFFILSLVLYNYRKDERGEQAYAYKFIYVICGILAGICGGYALSEIFILGADTKRLSAIGIVSFIAGALITTVVYGAVSERGFKNFKRSMVIGGISAAVYGIIVLVIVSGAFGFEKRIPASGKVTAATVTFDSETIEFTDAKDVIALHKAIIDKKADDEYKYEVDSPHTYVEITYDLGKGRQFVRSYFADKVKIKSELFKVYTAEERFRELQKTVDEANAYIEIWGTDYSDEDYVNLDGRMTKDEAGNLISVYKKELLKLGDNYFSVEKQESIVMDVTLYREEGSNQKTVCFFTTADFTETNGILTAFRQQDAEIKQ